MRYGSFTGPTGEYGMLLDFILPGDMRIPGMSINPKPGTEPVPSYNPYNLLLPTPGNSGFPQWQSQLGSFLSYQPGTGSGATGTPPLVGGIT